VPSHPPKDKPLTDVPDTIWAVARERERVVRALVEKPPAYGARSEMMAAAAAELGITLQYLYRLLKAYEADPRTRSLLPKVGAVCPARDTGAAIVMTRANTEAMNLMLEEISRTVAPGAHAAVVIDGAGWHTSDDRVVPSNITLVPLPPYSPELNAIERLWQFMRDTLLSHRLFADIGAILDVCCRVWNRILAEPGRIRSTCGYPWALQVKI